MADVHTCDECGKRLATMGGLEIHMAMAHGADAPDPAELEAMDPQPAMGIAPAPMPAASPPMGLPRAPKPVRPPRPPLFGGIDPAEPLAWILTVLLFLGGVVAVIHHPHPPSDVTTVAAQSPVTDSATRQVDEQNVLAGVDLHVDDLSADWTLKDARAATDADMSQLDGCLSPAVSDPLVAARFQDVDYKNGGGHLTVTSTISSSTQVATERLVGTGSPQYLQCEIRESEQEWIASGGTVHGTTVNPLTVSLPVPGHAYQFVTRFTQGGVEHTYTTDDFQLAVGRVKTHLIFGHCACTPYDVQQDLAIVNNVARKVQHLAVQA